MELNTNDASTNTVTREYLDELRNRALKQLSKGYPVSSELISEIGEVQNKLK